MCLARYKDFALGKSESSHFETPCLLFKSTVLHFPGPFPNIFAISLFPIYLVVHLKMNLDCVFQSRFRKYSHCTSSQTSSDNQAKTKQIFHLIGCVTLITIEIIKIFH